MSSLPGQNLSGELHTCSGIGWIKFDRESLATGSLGLTPEVRCVGQRFSEQFVPTVTGGGHADHSSPETAGTSSVSRRRPVTGPREQSDGFARVNEPTMALFCAGQLAMLLPPTTPTSTGSAAVPSVLAKVDASWTPCQVRCRGISFRLDKKADAGIAEEIVPVKQEHATRDEEAQQSVPVLGEIMGQLGTGAELLGGRVGAILWTLRGANVERGGPVQLATDTVHAAGRIVTQSGKIAKRSVEHVGQVATFPYRYMNGTAGQSGSNEDVEPRDESE